MSATVVWFRHDLRLADNPALQAAIESGLPVVPVFIWAPEEEGDWPPGAAAQWWLSKSLRSLDEFLQERGSRLVVRKGPSLQALRQLVRETGARQVVWNRRYEPAGIERDSAIKSALKDDGLDVQSFNGSTVLEPWESTVDGNADHGFTQWWRRNQGAYLKSAEEFDAPARLAKHEKLDLLAESGPSISDLGLDDAMKNDSGFRDRWMPGEKAGQAALHQFVREVLHGGMLYGESRHRPDVVGTSRLSPYLRHGELSPNQVKNAIVAAIGDLGGDAELHAEKYLRQIGWRDFGYQLLFHHPQLPDRGLRPEYDKIEWRVDVPGLQTWKMGQTGYPFIDAGMRELLTTGWMHNRARMAVGSFLTKDLLMDWRVGARWFWEQLVDADLASNTMNWQWVAGCGTDNVSPFRIFDPVKQGKQYDPDGQYIRRWVGEIALLPVPDIHAPWDASPIQTRLAGIHIGRDYPQPIVDHREARNRALAAFGQAAPAQ